MLYCIGVIINVYLVSCSLNLSVVYDRVIINGLLTWYNCSAKIKKKNYNTKVKKNTITHSRLIPLVLLINLSSRCTLIAYYTLWPTSIGQFV